GEGVARPSPPEFARPDARRTLVEEYWRLVDEADADGFVFENVRSITHPRNRPVLEALEAAAHRCGYKTRFVAANAADYGVPQRRQRVFLLGSKQRRPDAPKATHAA